MPTANAENVGNETLLKYGAVTPSTTVGNVLSIKPNNKAKKVDVTCCGDETDLYEPGTKDTSASVEVAGLVASPLIVGYKAVFAITWPDATTLSLGLCVIADLSVTTGNNELTRTTMELKRTRAAV